MNTGKTKSPSEETVQAQGASRRGRSYICQGKGTRDVPMEAIAPVSHQTGTEAKGIFTRRNIVASQNQFRATRSASVKSKIMTSQIDSSDRTDASVSGHVSDCQSEHTKTRSKSKNRKTRGYQCEQGRTINANQNEHGRSRNANQNEHGRSRNANQNEHGGTRNANQNEHGRSRNANQNEHGGTRNANQNEHGGTRNANHSEHGGSRNVNQSELNRTRSDSKKRRTRGNQIEHSRTRATNQSELDENRNAKQSGFRSENANDREHGEGGRDPGKRMTGNYHSEHTNTEVTSTESKSSGCLGKHTVAQIATATSTNDFARPVQGPSLTRTVHGAPGLGTGNQGGHGERTVDRPAGEGIKTKKRRKRKRHASESETNCTLNRSCEKTKAGDVFLHKKEDSRTKEQSSLEEGEIIDGGSSPLVRCQAHRKRRRHSYKARDSESMTTSAPKKFIGKVEIVRRHQKGKSFRVEKPGHKASKAASTGESIQGPSGTSAFDKDSVSRESSGFDSCQSGTANRSQVVNVKGIPVDQGPQCAATSIALEEGEINSESHVPGDLNQNELLPQTGSDMSISSEDSCTDERVPPGELKDSCLFKEESSSDMMATKNVIPSRSSWPAGSSLDPLAAVFVPRCSTSLFPNAAQQSSSNCTQPWPTFTAQSPLTHQGSQLWPRYQPPGSILQTQSLDSQVSRGYLPYTDPNSSFLAPHGSSIWSYLAAPQQQSPWVSDPFLKPPCPGASGSDMWATSSFRPGRRIHVSPAAATTCPEITQTPRGWQTVRQADRQAGNMEIKVMSYNILSQDLMNKHMYLYSKCSDQDLKWDNRGAALLTQIVAHDADIVCLQEVEKDHWLQDIRDTLAEQGYAGVYKKQSGDNTHGCAILFKTSKFQQLTSIPVEFMKGGILDRHNVGLILLLQPRQHVYGGQVKKICVATTHLLFNPRRGDVKLAQLMVLLAEIDKHAYLDDQPGSGQCQQNGHTGPVNDSSKLDQESQSGGPGCSLQFDQGAASSCETQRENGSARYCPIILCGDFNMEPLCDLYQFITNGYMKYDQCIARLVCGQEEGRWGGTDRLVDRKLLPSSLNICETCQYLHILKERWNRGGVSGSQPLPSVNSGQVWHSMNFQSVYTHFLGKGYRNREISTHHNNSSCTVDYIFYSQTATRYQRQAHRTGSDNGDSTFQVVGSQSDTQPDDSVRNRDIAAAVVDTNMGKDTVKEPLELIARYRLLKHKEVTKFGFMPNSVFPSDHLCLIAKFLLQ